MQQGRGGMGSHKHGISGHNGPSPGEKLRRARDENRLKDEQSRQKKVKFFPSVAELFRHRKTTS